MPPEYLRRPSVASILLYALLACLCNLPFTRSKTLLDPVGIYGSIAHAQECLGIAWNTARMQMKGNTIPNCLRFAFHDAGTYQKDEDKGGANGSIMKELNFAMFPMNNGLNLCGDAMKKIVATARGDGCPELTVADAIQVAGAAAVTLKGGPLCDMLMGRPDVETADDTSVLPSECSDAADNVANFARQGFVDPVTAVVTLSGAHNIGSSHVTKNSRCSLGIGPLTQGDSFDNHYYDEVVYGRKTAEGVRKVMSKGWFLSDTALQDPGAPTRDLMITYANNQSAFLDAWCPQYREMSLLGVDPGTFSIYDGWTPDLPELPTEYYCKFTPVPGGSVNGYVQMARVENKWMLLVDVKKTQNIIAANLHQGSRNNNGPVIASSFPAGSTISLSGDFKLRYEVSANLLDDQILMDKGYYINIHTKKNPDGEVRCQLNPQSSSNKEI